MDKFFFQCCPTQEKRKVVVLAIQDSGFQFLAFFKVGSTF